MRHIITERLFGQYVSENEAAFSHELYMGKDQLRCMARHGMYIGSHGYDHYWLNSLSPGKQAEEIDKSLAFLSTLGLGTDSWIMNYPYGAYNDSLIEIISGKGCKLALTTQVGVAEIKKENAFILPRLDTNDLPKNRQAEFKILS